MSPMNFLRSTIRLPFLLLTAVLCAQTPPPAGFSAERLGRLKAVLKESVDRKEFAGIHAAVMRKGRLALSESFGFADLDAGQ